MVEGGVRHGKRYGETLRPSVVVSWEYHLVMTMCQGRHLVTREFSVFMLH